MYLQGLKPMSEHKKEQKAVKETTKKAPKPPNAAGTKDAKRGGDEPRSKRAWHQKKLAPAQIKVICERFYGGAYVKDLMAEFNISRSSLYRYLEEYGKETTVREDTAYWRIECQRVKDLAMELALENKDLKAQIAALKPKS